MKDPEKILLLRLEDEPIPEKKRRFPKKFLIFSILPLLLVTILSLSLMSKESRQKTKLTDFNVTKAEMLPFNRLYDDPGKRYMAGEQRRSTNPYHNYMYMVPAEMNTGEKINSIKICYRYHQNFEATPTYIMTFIEVGTNFNKLSIAGSSNVHCDKDSKTITFNPFELVKRATIYSIKDGSLRLLSRIDFETIDIKSSETSVKQLGNLNQEAITALKDNLEKKELDFRATRYIRKRWCS